MLNALKKVWDVEPFVTGDELTGCILFVQEQAAALVIGIISMDGESGPKICPHSDGVEDDWNVPDTCEGAGAANNIVSEDDPDINRKVTTSQ